MQLAGLQTPQGVGQQRRMQGPNRGGTNHAHVGGLRPFAVLLGQLREGGFPLLSANPKLPSQTTIAGAQQAVDHLISIRPLAQELLLSASGKTLIGKTAEGLRTPEMQRELLLTPSMLLQHLVQRTVAAEGSALFPKPGVVVGNHSSHLLLDQPANQAFTQLEATHQRDHLVRIEAGQRCFQVAAHAADDARFSSRNKNSWLRASLTSSTKPVQS